MSVVLTKGQRVNLSKEYPRLSKVSVCLGWDANKYDGEYDFDLDASAFLLGMSGKIRKDSDFIFYNNLTHPSNAIIHDGDNRVGDCDEDDEVIHVDLSAIPAQYEKIVFAITIFDAESRLQNFGMISNAYIRIVDEERNEELCRYDLSEDFSMQTAIIAAEIYKRDNEWKFAPIGSGYNGGLTALCRSYGINVE